MSPWQRILNNSVVRLVRRQVDIAPERRWHMYGACDRLKGLHHHRPPCRIGAVSYGYLAGNPARVVRQLTPQP